MNREEYANKATAYLEYLCRAKPNRRTGSPGNQDATDFFANVVGKFGFQIDTTRFPCLDHVKGDCLLSSGDHTYDVFISPYSLGCDLHGNLVSADSVEELERRLCKGKILLMRGALCAEQLMPKNFVFYNPEHHQRIYQLLEDKEPAAIVTATSSNPELVGALYPYPLIVDGDFDIPNVYCTDVVGDEIANAGECSFSLLIEAARHSASANNVVAMKNINSEKKIIFTAHIDAYEDTPGASDNASGTVVLMLLAEMLREYRGHYGIEIVAINGEDHYSAGGEMDYLHRYGDQFDRAIVAVNIDDVGYIRGRSAYSFYDCPTALRSKAVADFDQFPGLTPGDPWYNGDHMVFVQNQVSSIAFTAELMPELMSTITHTSKDMPELIDTGKLVEVAQALSNYVDVLNE